MGRLPIFFVGKMDSPYLDTHSFAATSEKDPDFIHKAHSLCEFDSVKKGDWLIKTFPRTSWETAFEDYDIRAFRIVDKTTKTATILIDEEKNERIKLWKREVGETILKHTVLHNKERYMLFYWFMTDAEFREAIAPLL